MKRMLVLIYGIAAYFAFFITFLYLIGFTGNLVVAKSVDAGGSAGSAAFFVNLLLVALFGVQHSAMARPTFKRWWAQFVPKSIERNTYVIATCLVLWPMYLFWQPMPDLIWNFSGTLFGNILWLIFWLGWGIVLWSSFMINHFDLFGLRHAWLYFTGNPYQPIPFKVSGLYKWVRNPLMLGFLLAMWAHPAMSAGHLLFAGGMTAYIFVGIYFEERTIAEHLGEPYRVYKSQTPMVFPFVNKKK